MDLSLKNVILGTVFNWEDAQEFMRWASERHSCLAVDTETTGLNPYDFAGRIRMIQIGDAQQAWALPFERYSGLVAEVLEHYDGPIVWHNAAFDTRWLSVKAPWFPQRWDRLQDTMILARLAEPTKSAALKRLSNQLFGRSASLGQSMLQTAMDNNNWDWATVPFEYEGYSLYGAMDVILTARLWEYFQSWLVTHREVYETEMQVRRICTAMELKGFRVNLDYTRRKYDELNGYVGNVANWCSASYGFDINSPKQLREWLVEQGTVFEDYTPTGQPSTSKSSLDKMIIHPSTPDRVTGLIETLLKMRKYEKIANTYLANFDRFADADGILHAQINTLAARTSRMSVTDPALQTLGRDDTTVRNAFIPMEEDESLVMSDYSQIEARLTAHFSGDRNMIKAFETADATGGDFFTEMGKRIYGPKFTRADKRRSLVKNVTYASAYGAGVPKIALTAGVPLSIMEPVAAAIFDTFPGIRGMGAIAEKMARENFDGDGNPVVITPTGRELVLDPDKIYTAANYLIQGHAAEVLKRALINLDNLDLGQYMLLPVHDEVVFSIPTGLVEDVKPVIREAMTMTGEYLIDLPADPEGPYARWGEKYE